MGLLAIISTTLAYWIYYLLSWDSLAYLLYLYLLLCPWACWLLFLPCWPIGFITFFLGLPWPIYFTFTSYCLHGPAIYHFCHVGPLGLLPYFDHLDSFFLSFSLLLGFFCHWAFCQNGASTFSPLSMWIAPAIHMRIFLQFSFAGFFK